MKDEPNSSLPDSQPRNPKSFREQMEIQLDFLDAIGVETVQIESQCSSGEDSSNSLEELKKVLQRAPEVFGADSEKSIVYLGQARSGLERLVARRRLNRDQGVSKFRTHAYQAISDARWLVENGESEEFAERCELVLDSLASASDAEDEMFAKGY